MIRLIRQCVMVLHKLRRSNIANIVIINLCFMFSQRKWTNNLRFEPEQAARTQPQPNLPEGPSHKCVWQYILYNIFICIGGSSPEDDACALTMTLFACVRFRFIAKRPNFQPFISSFSDCLPIIMLTEIHDEKSYLHWICPNNYWRPGEFNHWNCSSKLLFFFDWNAFSGRRMRTQMQ